MTVAAIRKAVAESVEGVIVDRDSHEVWVDGQARRLPPKEFSILEALTEADGSILPRAELLTRIWGISAEDSSVDSRTVDQHVARLRRSLGKYAKAVITVTNCGYRASEYVRFKARRVQISVEAPKNFSDAMTQLGYWAGLREKSDVATFVAEATRLSKPFIARGAKR